MRYKINYDCWNSVFAVPAYVTDKYIAEASGVYVKILLLAIRSQENISSGSIAKILSIPEADVKEALAYWVGKGIFSTVDEVSCGVQGERESASGINSDKMTDAGIQAPAAIHHQNPSFISADEIQSRLKENEEIKFLAETAQELLGHPVNSTEMRYLIYIYDYFDFGADVILMIIDYCVKLGKKSVRYILKVCESWSEQGITSHESAEIYLKQLLSKNDNENQIKDFLGIKDRNFTDKEKLLTGKWFNEFKYTLPLIKFAFEKTINSTGKASFPYADKILSVWYEKGVKSIKDVEESKPAFTAASPGRNNKKRDPFDSSYDIDLLKGLEFKVNR